MLKKNKIVDNGIQKKFWSNKKNARSFNHEIVKFFASQRVEYVDSVINLKIIKNAFDVGCGDGFATYYYKKYIIDIYGGDISQEMIKNNPLSNDRLCIINAECMDNVKNNSYNLVNCWEVLHHLESPKKAVREMARISEKYVVIFEPNRYNVLQALFGALVPQERGTLRSTKKYLESICVGANLKIIESTYCGRIFPNKIPEVIFTLIKKLPFKASVLTGTSILIIGEK